MKRVHIMNRKQRTVWLGILCFMGVAVSHTMLWAAANEVKQTSWQDQFKQGSMQYQNKETGKALKAFKAALDAVFPGAEARAFKKGKALISLLDNEKSAARTRFELGLFYESQGQVDQAVRLFRDALLIVESQDARYLGYKDGCKSCHFKEWKSWKDTKMAQAFEVLKPGVSVEAKKERKFDPQKDYTEDPNCLPCHTTGYGLPGGYQIPRNARYKVRKAAAQNEGGTCEACHGPGSLYGPVHKDVDDKARPYRQEEFYAVGEYKVDAQVCVRCHNHRNPTAGADYHFDFQVHKDKDTHENFPLIYRTPDKAKGS